MTTTIQLPIITEFEINIEELTKRVLDKYFVEDFHDEFPEKPAILENKDYLDWCINEFKYCTFDMGMFYEIALEMLNLEISSNEDVCYDETDTQLKKSVEKYLKSLKKK